jgi:hypothetical protein
VQRLPLILIGSAGSGKTVLTLEKMKQMSSDVRSSRRSEGETWNKRPKVCF